ncbi:MAG: RDD family protein [Treponema sp.]|jgi:uncharacterized RDD family membrane protein YckC|nr:RDD family protein [Treponema sp.]
MNESYKKADSTLSVQTPEGIEFVLHPAGVAIRACAYGIDCTVQWIIIMFVSIITDTLDTMSGKWFLLLVIFLVNWFYFVIWELLSGGQSLGKRIMGIRVVRGDGSPINAGASFLRNLLRFADTFMSLNLIALISMAVSRGFRRLGDWAADTVVVYTASSRAPVKKLLMPWLSGIGIASPSRPLSYEEKQAVLMFARRYPLLGKARGDEIARGFAGMLRPAPAFSDDHPSGHGQTLQPDALSDSEFLLGIAHNLSGDVLRNTALRQDSDAQGGTP